MELDSRPLYPGTDLAIIGAGLAGLATAIRVKEEYPDTRVTVLSKSSPQSNTAIAGQRIRVGQAGVRENSEGELQHLLSERNGGVLTEQMSTISAAAQTTVDAWQSMPGFVATEDRVEWFGPRWGSPNRAGKGRGLSVLKWFRAHALSLGVEFKSAQVESLLRTGNMVTALALRNENDETEILLPNAVVLAAGTACGALFQSTNVKIDKSSHELAYAAGIPLTDATTHMVHPFANASSTGEARRGCHETDELADHVVYLPTGNGLAVDEESTQLLHDHKAHYHFPTIARRIRKHGGIATLSSPEGTTIKVRASLHYNHMGIPTDDGVRVCGVDNLFAVGDASGVGYWTNHRERLPGFALLKCLTDATAVAASLHATPFPAQREVSSGIVPDSLDADSLALLQRVNTRHLDLWHDADNATRRVIAADWVASLHDSLGSRVGSTLVDLSIAIAGQHGLRSSAETVLVRPEGKHRAA